LGGTCDNKEGDLNKSNLFPGVLGIREGVTSEGIIMEVRAYWTHKIVVSSFTLLELMKGISTDKKMRITPAKLPTITVGNLMFLGIWLDSHPYAMRFHIIMQTHR
jgi:hypothetical protein